MYCTVSDIITDVTEKALRELTDDSDIPLNYDTTLVESKITEASHYIDGYLVERYPLPIADTMDLEILKGICISLVVTDLYRRRIGLDYSESLQRRREEAISNLQKIQQGIIKLRTGNDNVKPRYYRYTKRTQYFSQANGF